MTPSELEEIRERAERYIDDPVIVGKRCARSDIPRLLEYLEELRAVLEATTNELGRWGMGDFHYGDTPQEPRVVQAVARAREVLGRAPQGPVNE